MARRRAAVGSNDIFIVLVAMPTAWLVKKSPTLLAKVESSGTGESETTKTIENPSPPAPRLALLVERLDDILEKSVRRSVSLTAESFAARSSSKKENWLPRADGKAVAVAASMRSMTVLRFPLCAATFKGRRISS